MMKYLTLSLVFLLVGCSGSADSEDAQSLLDEVQDADYRQNFARAPGWPDALMANQGGPHGSFVDIYINDVLSDALGAGEPLSSWPEGSIIVKDGFGDAEGSELKFLTIMEKRAGGEWFWAEFDSKQELDFSGLDLDTCTRCHDDGADGVLAFDFPE